MFTVEEMGLICIFDTSSRSSIISGIRASLHYVYDPDMRTLMENALSKLSIMPDDEFSQISFQFDYPDDDDTNDDAKEE